MITLATLKDEMVEGRCRAAGKKIRKLVIIALDNYNILIAEGSDPANPVGKHFYCKLAHMAKGLAEYGLEACARKKMLAFFERYSGESLGDLSWAEMDKRFEVGKRCTDSTGRLQLYPDLKAKGWKDDEAKAADAA